MVTRLDLVYERTFHHPLDAVYEWMTDYDDGDAQRTEAVIQDRQVLDRDEDQVVLAEHLSSLGLEREVRTLVELSPPDAWEATVHGPDTERPDVFTYELTAKGEGACRLTATYSFGVAHWFEKAMLWLIRPLVRREIARMWDGFEAAMDRELGVQRSP